MMTKRSLLIAGAVALALAPMGRAGAARRRMVVTGHLGNIGSRLLPYYRETWDVVGIDKKEGPEFDLAAPNDAWLSRLAGAVVVVHLAAVANPGGGVEEVYRNNVQATSVLVEAMMRPPLRRPRMVFASSTHACPSRYGNPAGTWCPASPYGASKLFAEALLENAARDGLLAAAIVRVGSAPPVGTDTTNAPPWIKNILQGDQQLRLKFDQGVHSTARFERIEP